MIPVAGKTANPNEVNEMDSPAAATAVADATAPLGAEPEPAVPAKTVAISRQNEGGPPEWLYRIIWEKVGHNMGLHVAQGGAISGG